MAEGRLLGLCGSLRKGSFNRMLMWEAARLFDPVEFIEGDIRLPLYDGDLEDAGGVPEAVQVLADQIEEADAVIIACPEYNKALPGGLKNALDWVSRTSGAPWSGKPVAIMSAAAGRAGGERTQMSLRAAMIAFRPRIVAGPEVMVAGASKQFDDGGLLVNEVNLKALTELMAVLRDEVALLSR